jgi:RHS repeat-associated protein
MTDSDPSQVCQGLSWTYDPWGNRTAQMLRAGACGTFSVAVNANNQFIGSPDQYDASGNMTHDASHSYSYDAEGHIIKVDGGSAATYVYDVNGRRIEQLTPHGGFGGALQTHFWYDTDGRIRTTWAQDGEWIDDYLYFGGEYIGFYSTLYAFRDILGSTRILTMPDKTVRDSYDFLPFAEQESGGTWALFKFTGKVRDIESGLDNFGARYNSSSMGRFMSPDPSRAGISMVDPQTWNRYVYARNNPLAYVDPNGKWSTPVHERIIDVVFNTILSAPDLGILKQASAYVDKFQGEAFAFEHGMRALDQPVWQARSLGEAFIFDFLPREEEVTRGRSNY